MLFNNSHKKFNSRKGVSRLYWWLGAAALVFLIISSCRNITSIKPTADMDIGDDFWVRVLLHSKINSCTIEIPDSSAIILVENGSIKERTLKGRTFKINFAAGQFSIGKKTFNASQITIKPSEPFVFKINNMSFRGNLRLVPGSKGQKFDAVNAVPLEAYLNGVVGCEMPMYWKYEALKAQAIAARTYCLYHKTRYGVKRHFDVRRTQANQVYRGVAAENWRVKKAVNTTAGKVMLSDGNIFPAYYSAVCGGHTEDSYNVFGKSFDALKAAACPYCAKVARKSKFYWKPIKYDPNELDRRLVQKYEKIKSLGKIVKIEPRRKSQYDGFARWTNVKLTGQNGKTITLRAEDMRLSLDPTGMKLKSTIFDLAKLDGQWVFFGGRGFGHGVGMCQCGAQGLAKKGKKAEEILKYYYKDIEIKGLY